MKISLLALGVSVLVGTVSALSIRVRFPILSRCQTALIRTSSRARLTNAPLWMYALTLSTAPLISALSIRSWLTDDRCFFRTVQVIRSAIVSGTSVRTQQHSEHLPCRLPELHHLDTHSSVCLRLYLSTVSIGGSVGCVEPDDPVCSAMIDSVCT